MHSLYFLVALWGSVTLSIPLQKRDGFGGGGGGDGGGGGSNFFSDGGSSALSLGGGSMGPIDTSSSPSFALPPTNSNSEISMSPESNHISDIQAISDSGLNAGAGAATITPATTPNPGAAPATPGKASPPVAPGTASPPVTPETVSLPAAPGIASSPVTPGTASPPVTPGIVSPPVTPDPGTSPGTSGASTASHGVQVATDSLGPGSLANLGLSPSPGSTTPNPGTITSGDSTSTGPNTNNIAATFHTPLDLTPVGGKTPDTTSKNTDAIADKNSGAGAGPDTGKIADTTGTQLSVADSGVLTPGGTTNSGGTGSAAASGDETGGGTSNAGGNSGTSGNSDTTGTSGSRGGSASSIGNVGTTESPVDLSKLDGEPYFKELATKIAQGDQTQLAGDLQNNMFEGKTIDEITAQLPPDALKSVQSVAAANENSNLGEQRAGAQRYRLQGYKAPSAGDQVLANSALTAGNVLAQWISRKINPPYNPYAYAHEAPATVTVVRVYNTAVPNGVVAANYPGYYTTRRTIYPSPTVLAKTENPSNSVAGGGDNPSGSLGTPSQVILTRRPAKKLTRRPRLRSKHSTSGSFTETSTSTTWEAYPQTKTTSLSHSTASTLPPLHPYIQPSTSTSSSIPTSTPQPNIDTSAPGTMPASGGNPTPGTNPDPGTGPAPVIDPATGTGPAVGITPAPGASVVPVDPAAVVTPTPVTGTVTPCLSTAANPVNCDPRFTGKICDLNCLYPANNLGVSAACRTSGCQIGVRLSPLHRRCK